MTMPDHTSRRLGKFGLGFTEFPITLQDDSANSAPASRVSVFWPGAHALHEQGPFRESTLLAGTLASTSNTPADTLLGGFYKS
jgi:hypothetical protein